MCTIRPVSGGIVYAAAPISLIFSLADELSSIQTSDSSLPLPIRSEDVFLHVSPLSIPIVKGKTALPTLDLVSVRTNSWKVPNLCEFDAQSHDQTVSTRILLSVRLFFGPDIFYVLFQLGFSPTTASANRAIGEAEDFGSASRFLLTCQQQSPLYSFDEDFPETVHLTSASRTGRAFGSFVKFKAPARRGNSKASYLPEESTITSVVCAINMHDLLGVVDPAAVLGQKAVHSRLTGNLFTEDDEDDLVRLNVEEFSGALWYRRGKSVIIHYFD